MQDFQCTNTQSLSESAQIIVLELEEERRALCAKIDLLWDDASAEDLWDMTTELRNINDTIDVLVRPPHRCYKCKSCQAHLNLLASSPALN